MKHMLAILAILAAATPNLHAARHVCPHQPPAAPADSPTAAAEPGHSCCHNRQVANQPESTPQRPRPPLGRCPCTGDSVCCCAAIINLHLEAPTAAILPDCRPAPAPAPVARHQPPSLTLDPPPPKPA